MIPAMRWVALTLVVACLPGTCPAQSNLDVDLGGFSPSGQGLLAARAPVLDPDRLEIMLGADWGHRLFGLRTQEGGGTTWIVKHRLSLRAAVVYTPTSAVSLSAGFTGAAHQEGIRTNNAGAPVEIRPGMGVSFVGALWSVPLPDGLPIHAGLETALLFPTASPEALCGGEGVNFRAAALLSYRIWLVTAVVNLGIVTRTRTRFYDLVRDDGLQYRAGAELGIGEWPVAVSAEVAGETPLDSAFAMQGNDFAEALFALRIRGVMGLDLSVGAGFGLLGTGVPAVRGLVLARWSGKVEKIGGREE